MKQRIVHYAPRLGCGGMESELATLLAAMPGSEVLYEHDGPGRPRIEARASRVTHARSSFGTLLERFRGADIAHLHTINHFGIPSIAAQIAGAKVVLQTLHNQITPSYAAFCDWTVIAQVGLLDFLVAPSASDVIPNCIEVPAEVPDRPLPCEKGSIRLVEIRRADKQMAFTLEDLVATGALDGLPIHVEIVGVGGESRDPRVRRAGLVPDARPHLEAADLLVSASAMDTFGRTVFEAMASGALPVATPLPCFQNLCGNRARVEYLPTDEGPLAAAQRLRVLLVDLLSGNYPLRGVRAANHVFARASFSPAVIAPRWQVLYTRLVELSPGFYRNFRPDDVPSSCEPAFIQAMDFLALEETGRALELARGLPASARGIIQWLAGHGTPAVPARMRLFEQALDALGPRHALLLDIARLAGAVGQVETALSILDFADPLRPDHTPVLVETVRLALARQDFGRAKTALERLAERDPRRGELAQLQAHLEGLLQEHQAASEAGRLSAAVP